VRASKEAWEGDQCREGIGGEGSSGRGCEGREPVPALGALQFELVGSGSGDGSCDDRGGEDGRGGGDDGDNDGRTTRSASTAPGMVAVEGAPRPRALMTRSVERGGVRSVECGG
jgi:hypothetical protein